jgi:hypothetical protein
LRPCKYIITNELVGKDFNSLLEVGCQWGENLMAINEKFPGKKLVGIDIDPNCVKIGKEITGLDLREENAFNINFNLNKFDVVCTEAFFTNILPGQVDMGLRKIIQSASKYIILVELKIYGKVGSINSKGRTAADWCQLFSNYGLTAEEKIIPIESWDVEPWKTYGRIITVKL